MTDTSQPTLAESQSWTLYVGDARCVLAGVSAGSANCIVTSPPYWGKRDYGVAGRHGHAPSTGAYGKTMRDVFREARRVLAGDGTCWLSLGDSCSASSGGATGLRTCPGPHTTHRATGMHATILILSHGMLSAGWHARKLNAVGKFPCSPPEHDTPRRPGAYPLTDDDESSMAARYAPGRPSLDAISRLAPAARPPAPPATIAGLGDQPDAGDAGTQPPDDHPVAALPAAPAEGISVATLVAITRMSWRWTCCRPGKLAASGLRPDPAPAMAHRAPGRPAMSPGTAVHDVHMPAPARVPARNPRSCTVRKHAGAWPRPTGRDHP